MDRNELQNIVNKVEFQGEKFVVIPKGDGFLIQLQYMEKDVDDPDGPPTLQKARKWYVSPYSTESEVVQTCLLACLTSMEHRCREHFTYNGFRLFGPHITVGAHIEASHIVEHRPDQRVPETLPCGCSRSVLSVQEGWKVEYGHPSLTQMHKHDKCKEKSKVGLIPLATVEPQTT